MNTSDQSVVRSPISGSASPVRTHPSTVARNIKSLPVLLRAMAGSDNARATKQDVIFAAAAKLIERLEADLNECREYLEDEMDVIDGDYGIPSPNRAMRLVNMIDESLHGPGAF